MTLEMWIVLAILGVAIFLFITEWIRVDLVALGVVVALVTTQTLSTGEALAGFSNTSVLTIVFLFVVGAAIMQTGLAASIGQNIVKVAGTGETRLIVVLMVVVALLSGFMSNTGTVAVLLPAVIILAKRADLSPSKLLIPLSFGSMLGGATTLIGTAPNLMVNDALLDAGLTPFGFFDFLPMGAALVITGVLFMLFVGRFLLPDRRPAKTEQAETAQDLAARYSLTENMRRFHILATSPLAGKTVRQTDLRPTYGLTILKIVRPSERVRITDLGHNIDTRKPRDTMIVPEAETLIEIGDHLIVEGNLEQMSRAAKEWGCELLPIKPKDTKALVSNELGIAEVILRQRSNMVGKTLASSDFRDRYKLSVLEVRRPPHATPLPLDAELRFADVLLVQGWWENILKLRDRKRDFILLGDPEEEMGAPNAQKASMALIILAGMVVLMAVGWLPIIGEISVVMVALIAAMAVVLTGCVSMEDAYRAIDWRSIVLIAGILPVSTAMTKVGLVDVMATVLVDTLGDFGPYAVLVGIFLLTATLTQVISNTATAVVIAPLALATATVVNVDPHAYLMAVAIAASCAFVSPVASPTNTLVLGAGNYSFADYAKVGLPLLIVCMIVSVIMLPILFPF